MFKMYNGIPVYRVIDVPGDSLCGGTILMTLWACQGCQICGSWGLGTHRLSLIGFDTLVHRPHKMAVEGNVCIVLTTFCFIWSNVWLFCR